ncbi:MAG: ATP-binding protein [Desulfobacterales bacterium]|nr:ATP-binding protein [Desulfobacterales bacterium]
MNHNILVINYRDEGITDLSKSKFFDQARFVSLSMASDQELFYGDDPPDIVVVFISEHVTGCLKKIAKITTTMVDMEIIAAVSNENAATGVKALQSGASDFILLPAPVSTFDYYINRALERIYMHKHICFNDSCYKSRYAQSQQSYQELFNEVPCFIYVIDRDYHIKDANRKFIEYFGDNIGDYCFGICKNRDEPCRHCPVRETFKDGKNHASETEIISSDGVKHTVLSWTAPIRDPNGEINKVIVMLTDITEARRLEDHLTSLGYMIGSISHGIKGLLTNLDGGMYLLDTGLSTHNHVKAKQGYELSVQTVDRIKKLVLDILYYAKTRTLEWEKVSVRTFVEDIIKTVSMKAIKNQIIIDQHVEVVCEDDYFEIDHQSLEASMVNILENSIDACLAKKDGNNPTITFHVRVDREKVLFKIKDNGLGMDDATLNNMFTIFFSSKGNKGTGLGLFIANKVIRQHRGEVKVRSSMEKGTKFIVKIPRTVPPTARKSSRVSIYD